MFTSLQRTKKHSKSKLKDSVANSNNLNFSIDTDHVITESWRDYTEVTEQCYSLFIQKINRLNRLDALEKGQLESDTSSSDSDKPNYSLKDNIMTEMITPDHLTSTVWEDHFTQYEKLNLLKERLILQRRKHIIYLQRHILSLPNSMLSLDASRPWILYWITHSLTLLEPDWFYNKDNTYREIKRKMVLFLYSLQSLTGGYGGGSRQLPHLAPTYAAIATLVTLGTNEALRSIDRQKIYNFIKRLRDSETGGFRVHENGEVDVRGAYCAVAVASLLHIVTEDLFLGLEDYISSLQTYDGGLASGPGLESHGGYTYCGVAALAILDKLNVIDTEKLLFWTLQRQTDSTGAFQGRPNKLPDSCYSFWCSGTLMILSNSGFIPKQFGMDSKDPIERAWFDHLALQTYILGCCQETLEETSYKYRGGLRDKPSASQDLYHSCYALSGLAVSQYTSKLHPVMECIGPDPGSNRVNNTHALYNVTNEALVYSRNYFLSLPAFIDNETGAIGSEGIGVLIV